MNRRLLYTAMFLIMAFACYGQIFEQKFNFGNSTTQYFNVHDANRNQFTYISSHGTQRSSVVSGALRFTKTGNSSAQVVKAKFDNSLDFLYITFKYRLSDNDSADPTAMQGRFFVGDKFTNDPVIPVDSENVHSKFSFYYTGKGAFKLGDMRTGALSPEFSGQQQITFVVNNSGKEKAYPAPNNTQEKLGNSKWDLWIGNTKVFDEREATSSHVPLNGFKFQIQSGAINAITDLDDFEVYDLKSLLKPQKEKILVNGLIPNYTETFVATKKWLQIPVKNRETKRNVNIEADNGIFRSFSVELANNEADWYAYIDLTQIKGKSFTIMVDSLLKSSIAFSNIKQLDKKPKDNNQYKEKYRGQIHYSVAKGWNNDPNGMVYYKGEYHLFYQYNPYGNRWGNMHWGHAVSKDLIHWKELDIALYPDENGFMYSGGGIVDLRNTSGLSDKIGQDPLIVYYTATGPPRVQGLAYSTDGRNFKKLSHPVVKSISPFNRDPKVLWHEPTKKWVMVLYVEEKGEQHTMRFFNSSNMIDWEETSVFYGGKGKEDKYLYECPEFYELPVVGSPQEKKWILVGADGQYAIGSFDGKKFRAEQERLHSVIGKGYYAGQQFSNEPKGRKIEMGWYRTNTDQVNMNFSQSFSIPMEMKLVRTSQGLRVVRKPVEEFKVLREKTYSYTNERISETLVKDVQLEVQEIEAVISPQQANKLTINIRGISFTYLPLQGQLVYKDQKVDVPLENGKLKIHAFVDKTGIEFFVNDGLVFIPVNVNLDAKNTGITFGATGEGALVEYLNIYKLASIW